MFRTYYPAAFWTLLIIALLCIPGKDLPEVKFKLQFTDKIIHIFLFALLHWVWAWSIGKRNPQKRTPRTNTLVLVGCIVLGILMEIVQGAFIPARSFELADILADSVGAFIGFLIIRSRLSIQSTK